MDHKLARDDAPLRRDGRGGQSRCPNPRRQRSITAAAEAAVEQAHGGRVISRDGGDEGGGVVRVKIVLSKQQLRQLVASTGGGGSSAAHQAAGAAPVALERLVHVLRRRRHARRAEGVKGHRSGWRPVLQSIPEEI